MALGEGPNCMGAGKGGPISIVGVGKPMGTGGGNMEATVAAGSSGGVAEGGSAGGAASAGAGAADTKATLACGATCESSLVSGTKAGASAFIGALLSDVGLPLPTSPLLPSARLAAAAGLGLSLPPSPLPPSARPGANLGLSFTPSLLPTSDGGGCSFEPAGGKAREARPRRCAGAGCGAETDADAGACADELAGSGDRRGGRSAAFSSLSVGCCCCACCVDAGSGLVCRGCFLRAGCVLNCAHDAPSSSTKRICEVDAPFTTSMSASRSGRPLLPPASPPPSIMRPLPDGGLDGMVVGAGDGASASTSGRLPGSLARGLGTVAPWHRGHRACNALAFSSTEVTDSARTWMPKAPLSAKLPRPLPDGTGCCSWPAGSGVGDAPRTLEAGEDAGDAVPRTLERSDGACEDARDASALPPLLPPPAPPPLPPATRLPFLARKLRCSGCVNCVGCVEGCCTCLRLGAAVLGLMCFLARISLGACSASSCARCTPARA
mmetsp:Transcript_9158/g.28422  ORF Transcript_9158/g.28422 Transcript_9158/m.28422 type:complete len:494 (+) Transcript_9158:801-2282(+)